MLRNLSLLLNEPCNLVATFVQNCTVPVLLISISKKKTFLEYLIRICIRLKKKKKCNPYLRSKSVGLKHIYIFIYKELRIAVFFLLFLIGHVQINQQQRNNSR